MVKMCPGAAFCCAGALCKWEFLTLADVLEAHRYFPSRSELREIHGVFSYLDNIGIVPKFAFAN